jgi:S-(hydroxymethyl)glutathione dehydrogenase/alcohol dehydrogenase
VQTEGAILWELGAPWSVETIELDRPKAGEVLIELAASGLCHSDEHKVTGDIPTPFPFLGGHEGAGVVTEVGPEVTSLAVGDRVVTVYVPSCGRCRSCATGHSNLCDSGQFISFGRLAEGSARHHARGQDLNTTMALGTFARHTVVGEASCVKIDDRVPLDLACLVGCGATTGWGSAVYAAEVRPGDTVAVIGVGGIGAAAIQGARLAGADRIFAIDPAPLKWELAPTFGATDVAPSVAEAKGLIRDATRGRMCDKVICTMGVGSGELMADVMRLVAKRGRVVVTNIHPRTEATVSLSLYDLTLMEKQIVGSLFGSANPHYDIPHLLALHQSGQFDLAAMVTSRYPLADINQGYRDMYEGQNIRGVLVYD